MSVSFDRTVKPESSSAGDSRVSAQQNAAVKPAYHRDLLYTLALGTFAVGTEAFMIAAILPPIARSLNASVQATGQLVTIFALTYALSSPLLTALTAAWPRRRLLMLSLVVFIAGNLIAAAAPNYWFLAGARVLLGLAAGIYTPNANAVASALVPAGYRGRALAIVNGGLSVATAVGVPAGAFVGAHFGWRTTFLGVAGLSMIALAVLAVTLPREIAAGAPAGLKARLAVIALPSVSPTLIATLLWATGIYSVYTYVSPFLTAAGDLSPDDIGLVLILLGVCAVGGVWLGGYANDRFGTRRVQAVMLPHLTAAFAGLTLAAVVWAPHAILAILPMVALWGVSAWGFLPSQQARLVGVVGAAHTPVVLSVNSSFTYLGCSLGAGLGSIVITLLPIVWIGAAGACCLVCAMVASSVAWRRSPTAAVGS